MEIFNSKSDDYMYPCFLPIIDFDERLIPRIERTISRVFELNRGWEGGLLVWGNTVDPQPWKNRNRLRA